MNLKRIIRNRRRTPIEVDEDRKVRELIEREKPDLNAMIRRIIAEKQTKDENFKSV
jgi:hypothetical protein